MNDEKLLQAHGWTCECQSPLEIRHSGTGCFATGQAARLVLASLRENDDEALSAPDSRKALLEELVTLSSRVSLIAAAAELSTRTDPWKHAYQLVFGEELRARLAQIFQELELEFSYYDPDATYREDVLAYAHALEEHKKVLEPLLVACTLEEFNRY